MKSIMYELIMVVPRDFIALANLSHSVMVYVKAYLFINPVLCALNNIASVSLSCLLNSAYGGGRTAKLES